MPRHWVVRHQKNPGYVASSSSDVWDLSSRRLSVLALLHFCLVHMISATGNDYGGRKRGISLNVMLSCWLNSASIKPMWRQYLHISGASCMVT